MQFWFFINAPKLPRLATRNPFDCHDIGWIPFSALGVALRGNRAIKYLQIMIKWPNVKCVKRAIDIVMCNQKCHPLHLISAKFYQCLQCEIAKILEIKVPKYPPMVDYNDTAFFQVIVLIKTFRMIHISLI